MLPNEETLERIFLDALLNAPKGLGVSFLDLAGTGITEENIEQIANNLRTGMYASDFDDLMEKDD